MRLIRNLWATLTNAIEVLVLNPKGLKAEEKIKAVLEILAVGTGAILQPIIAEFIGKALAPYLSVPGAHIIREVFAQFIGIAAGGLVSVTLLHFIENSPLAQQIISMIAKAGALTVEVGNQISELIGVEPKYLFASRQSLLLMAGSAFCFGPVGVASVVGGQMMLAPIHQKLDKLQTGLSQLHDGQENLLAALSSQTEFLQNFEKKTYAYFNLLVEGQKRQYQALQNLEAKMLKGFAQTQATIKEIPEATIKLFAEYHLQDRMDDLEESLKNIEAALKKDDFPAKDLEKVFELATSVRHRMEKEWERQNQTFPARFPILLAAIFALAAEYKARSLLNENLQAALEALKRWRQRAKEEALALMKDASLYQLVTERSYLAGQYAVAFRMMGETDMLSNSFNAIAWDDGLNEARGIFKFSKEAPAPEWEEFSLMTAGERKAWQKLARLPRGNDTINLSNLKRAIGLPEKFSLTQDQAREVAVQGINWMEEANDRLKLSLKETA